MSSLQTLRNPVQRLGNLPTAMNWRGLWNSGVQYYLNDVVVSPTNGASYVLAGATASYEGIDPITNPIWVELSDNSTAVHDIQGGAGINVSTPAPDVKQIDNTGVITLNGSGVTLSGLSPNNRVITNNGLLALTAGQSITITGGSQNPTISGFNGTETTFANENNYFSFQLLPAYVNPNGNSQQVIMTNNPLSNTFNDYLINGAPDPNGTFMIDFSGVSVSTATPVSGIVEIGILYSTGSGTNTATYNIPVSAGGVVILNTGTGSGLGTIGNLGKVALNVAQMRAATNIQFPVVGFTITNNTTQSLSFAGCANTIFASYVPNGIV